MVFHPFPFHRSLAVIFLGGYLTFIGVMAGTALFGDGLDMGPGAPAWTQFVMIGLFLAGFAWLSFWFLYAVAWDVRFDGTELWWETCFGKGSMMLNEVTEIGSWFVSIRVSGTNNRLLLFPAGGARFFLEEMVRTRVDLQPIEIGRLVETLGQSSKSGRVFYEPTPEYEMNHRRSGRAG